MAIIDPKDINAPHAIPNPQAKTDEIYNWTDLMWAVRVNKDQDDPDAFTLNWFSSKMAEILEKLNGFDELDYYYGHDMPHINLNDKNDREFYRELYKVEAPNLLRWERTISNKEDKDGAKYKMAYIPYWPGRPLWKDNENTLQDFKNQMKDTFGNKDFWKDQGTKLLANLIGDLFKPKSKGPPINPDHTLMTIEKTLHLWGAFIWDENNRGENYNDFTNPRTFYDESSKDKPSPLNQGNSRRSPWKGRYYYQRDHSLILDDYDFYKFSNHPLALIHRIGPDFLSHKFDAYWLWDLKGITVDSFLPWASDYQKGILSKEGFAVRFGQISIPKVTNKSFSIPVLETQIDKIGSTKEMSNQASFTFRLDQDLIWLDAINALTGRVNTIDELIANSSGEKEAMDKYKKRVEDGDLFDTTFEQDEMGFHKVSETPIEVPPQNSNNHWYVAAKANDKDLERKQLDWRKLFKTIAQAWPTDATNSSNRGLGFNLKTTKLSLLISMQHLGNIINPDIQTTKLPHILFENVKILGTSDKISYSKSSETQSITVNFIYKKKYIIMNDNYKSYPTLGRKPNLGGRFNQIFLRKWRQYNAISLRGFGGYNREVIESNKQWIRYMAREADINGDSAGFFAGLVNKLFPKNQGLFEIGGSRVR